MADRRPPRAAPPPFLSSPTSPTRSPPPVTTSPPPQIRPTYNNNAVTFSEPRPRYSAVNQPSDETVPNDNNLTYQEHDDGENLTSPNEANFRRKKSLVRPDRERIDPNHRQWYYRNHAAQMADGSGVIPSTTGNAPLRRGKSLLNREEDFPEGGNGLSRLRSRATRRKKEEQPAPQPSEKPKGGLFSSIPGPKDAWVIYCYALTACFPPFLLNLMSIRSPEQQRAWREKMGLISIVVSLMAGVGFLTFGFTKAVCHSPPTRYETGTILKNYLIVHGFAYDLGKWKHPAVANVFTGQTNPLFDGVYDAGGMDASFLFQKVNQKCAGHITLSTGSSVSVDSKGNLGWYFPCNLYNQNGTTGPNLSGYDQSKNCHTTAKARTAFSQLPLNAQVYYSWQDVSNLNRNLAVYESTVLDFSLLNWLDKAQVTYPPLFDQLKNKNGTFNGKDLSMWFTRTKQKPLAACLQDIVTVGFVDTRSIGCVASSVVIYVSLVFIIGVVSIKFVMAVLFGWFLSWRIGSFANETYQERRVRQRAIEDWTDNIFSNAPAAFRPTVKDSKLNAYGADKRKSVFFPTTSRFSQVPSATTGAKGRPTTMYRSPGTGSNTPTGGGYGSKAFLGSAEYGDSRSSTSLNLDPSCPWPLARDVVPQPPPGYEPHNYPLSHTICLVTAYSESVEGLRTTLDSLATTDYPNSHKLLMVIADGMVKGSGNALTTPEIVCGMMKDFVIPPDEVQAHSYVAIADGHKRHNMAKVFAGFYDYSNATVEPSKQQRVPMVLVAKVGNPLERHDAKPGNRGKRDSQIVLMSFLQKVMFDERMTTFEYEFFNSIWRVTGISPDRYEMVLCVDADTKVFPDSVARMVACMVHDEEIMGLCGETKIANKGETWVTMIQVFEYYISHHLTKAFESMFGGVTCLPGCFSMYRIKAPKGDAGFWVPILANPDIVEHYSENIVDTLHKKNLLLLGEDRYLTTLMLKTFPKRKMIFCPQAVCKTIVPDTFSVLLSQRRRWINSTVHNLAELLLVRDLCGTFCFSMQFVVFMELAGTLVLPAAISFTIFLIVDTILPSTKEKPIISLILLGIILGLPGLLIVITSRKVEYVGWMLIYFLSLPIWNFVLPAYAFWHFDDFSWGQTRMVAGEKAGANHGDKEGEFDSSHIVMKRWAEFERDRRFNRGGGHSRDSTYGVEYYGQRDSPKQRDSRRFSVVSSGEMLNDQYRPQLPSKDSYESEGSSGGGYHQQQRRGDLMLPAPLAVGVRRTADDDQGSDRRLIPSSQDYHSSPDEVDVSAVGSFQGYGSPVQSYASPGPSVRHGQVAQGNYPGETQNPYRLSLPQVAATSNYHSDSPTATEEDHTPSQRATRGVSLVDNGPVLASGERRVPRPSARRQSAKPQQAQPTSFSATTEEPARPPRSHRPVAGPPPGAASPRSPQQGWNDPRYQ